jgi:hypothetical protein
MGEKLLPNIEENLSGTSPENEDQIISLKEQIETLERALHEANSERDKLRAHNEKLKDHDAIKRTALRFARTSMLIVPLICLALLMSTGFKDSFFGFPYAIELETYAQAAPIIAPIAFLALSLGFC